MNFEHFDDVIETFALMFVICMATACIIATYLAVNDIYWTPFGDIIAGAMLTGCGEVFRKFGFKFWKIA